MCKHPILHMEISGTNPSDSWYRCEQCRQKFNTGLQPSVIPVGHSGSRSGFTVVQLVNELKRFEPDKDVLLHNSDGSFMTINHIEDNAKFDGTACVVIRQW
jgi:hypothetical protein